MDTKLYDTLDSILRKYYDSATPDGEKEACLNVFRKKCKNNNIDPEEYKSKFDGKKNTSSSERSSRRSSSYGPGMNSDDFMNWFWEQMKRNYGKSTQGNNNSYNQRYGASYGFGFGKQRPYNEHKDKQDFGGKGRAEQYGPNDWEVKDPIYEIKVHNGKQVILFSTLARQLGSDKAFAIQNFCIYSKHPENLQWFDKTKHYRIKSGVQKYFRDHLIVEKIWIIDSAGYEIELEL